MAIFSSHSDDPSHSIKVNYLQTLFHAQVLGIFITSLRIKFSIPSSEVHWLSLSNCEINENFHTAAKLTYSLKMLP
jgi:hypothetical protein